MSVPDRSVVPVFAAMLNVTVPLPEPVAPLVIVIHDTLLAAVQEHPVPFRTDTLPVPADDVNV